MLEYASTLRTGGRARGVCLFVKCLTISKTNGIVSQQQSVICTTRTDFKIPLLISFAAHDTNSPVYRLVTFFFLFLYSIFFFSSLYWTLCTFRVHEQRVNGLGCDGRSGYVNVNLLVGADHRFVNWKTDYRYLSIWIGKCSEVERNWYIVIM